MFAAAGRAALGVVRAKTGNLNTVAALAGIAYAKNGQLLAFAVMADKLQAPGALDQAAATAIARVATALARCGCRCPLSPLPARRPGAGSNALAKSTYGGGVSSAQMIDWQVATVDRGPLGQAGPAGHHGRGQEGRR